MPIVALYVERAPTSNTSYQTLLQHATGCQWEWPLYITKELIQGCKNPQYEDRGKRSLSLQTQPSNNHHYLPWKSQSVTTTIIYVAPSSISCRKNQQREGPSCSRWGLRGRGRREPIESEGRKSLLMGEGEAEKKRIDLLVACCGATLDCCCYL